MHPLTRTFKLLAIMGSMVVPAVGRADDATKPGQLVVVDQGNLFSEAGISRAKEEFARFRTKTGRQVFVQTLRELPQAEAANYSKIDPKDAAAIRKFWHDFTMAKAKADQARGVYILICRKPGYVQALPDREMRNKGFDETRERQLSTDLVKAMRDSAKEKTEADKTFAHDQALMSAIEYLEKNLPASSADAKQPIKPTTKNGDNPIGGHGEGWGVGQWICLGVAVLAGVWVIFAIVRAMSGGGGMTGGSGMSGGGFFSSLLGGMFGAAAGMWIYDQFLGGHSSHSGDYGRSGDYDNAGADSDTGAGDFSGDAGSGGSFDDGGGDFGGADFGGGDFGGDSGGGGDF